MAQPAWHAYLNKANHNQKLIDLLETQGTDGFPDWVVVAMFYKGLHWLSAWLTEQKCPRQAFNSHGSTRATIHFNPRVPSSYQFPVSKHTYNAYIDLYDMSITARYDGFLDEEAMKKLSRSEIENAKYDLGIIKNFIEGRGLSLNLSDTEESNDIV
jgi:hypothetical protein